MQYLSDIKNKRYIDALVVNLNSISILNIIIKIVNYENNC